MLSSMTSLTAMTKHVDDLVAHAGAVVHDLRAILRSGGSDAELSDAVAAIWLRRGDRYSELRSQATSTLPRIEMFAMGG